MRPVLILMTVGVIAVCGCTEAAPAPREKSLEGKKIVMIIASQNFRDEELVEPRAILSARGAKVILASSSLAEATGMLGAKAKADMLIDRVNVADYDAIVFVGGMGASEYFGNTKAHELCRSAVDGGKVLCAICIAPGILANAGVLKGKKATIWSGSADMLKKGGATYTGKDVEVDGKIITGTNPKAAAAFGRAIADALAK